jgi:hypothetical protein
MRFAGKMNGVGRNRLLQKIGLRVQKERAEKANNVYYITHVIDLRMQRYGCANDLFVKFLS